MKPFNILLAIYLFISGWFIGLITEDLKFLRFTLDVPIFNVINLVVVSLFGWYISYCIQTSQRKTKSKIDLYSSKIDDIDSELKRLCSIIKNTEGAYYPEIVSLEKYCRSWYKKTYESFDDEFKETYKNDNEYINDNLIKIRSLLTNSSIIEANCTDIKIKNNIVKYSNTRISEIDTRIDSIRHKLYKLKEKVVQI